MQPIWPEIPRILPLVGTSSFSNSTSTVKRPICCGFSALVMSKIERLAVEVTYIVLPTIVAPTPSPTVRMLPTRSTLSEET